MMNNNFFLLLAAIVFSFSQCSSSTENYETLRQKYDSLATEHEHTEILLSGLETTVMIIDSIEIGYEALNFELEVGTDYNTYEKKMSDIASYIDRAEDRIVELENKLGNDAVFIASLRKELSIKTQKIQELEKAIEDLKEKNDKLFNLVMVQGQTLHNKTTELELKKQELELIEAHIQELMKQGKESEANGYFARAEALEEAANRTQLAPRKKKETLKEALELYIKSMEGGNESAAAKVEELRRKLN